MRRFYVKEISAWGVAKEPSIITFKDGVNIIYGPSNTGKSYAMGCINFMFGSSDIPFSKIDTGYEKIEMLLEATDGGSIRLERGIRDGKKGEVGESKVYVFSNITNIESKEYSIPNFEYSDLLLRIFGVKERHKIISSKECASQNLTIRTIFHMFFIDEDSIFRKGTVVDVPKHSKITASITALNFLLTSKDYHELAIEEKKEISDAKKAAVIHYINSKIQDLATKRGHLKSVVFENRNIDVEGVIEEIIEEITSIEQDIIDASENSRKMLEKIYETSSRLEEASFLEERYKALNSQYVSDVNRLKFIIDGEEKAHNREIEIRCPFCESSMPKENKKQSYIEAAKTELEHINLYLQDLKYAEEDIVSEMHDLEAQMRELNVQNEEITDLIDNDLRMRAADLKKALESHNMFEKIRQEIAAMDSITSVMSTDVLVRENESDLQNSYDAKKYFDSQMFKIWNEIFEATVKKCGYPNCMTASISKDTFDAVINGKQKKNEGKGYRAFLNTIMAFTIMKFIEGYGKFAPRMLFLDSPILSLKERGSEEATAGMKANLFRYLISDCGQCQIIITENEIPTTVDYSSVNLIKFTMRNDEGRYGFLRDVENN